MLAHDEWVDAPGVDDGWSRGAPAGRGSPPSSYRSDGLLGGQEGSFPADSSSPAKISPFKRVNPPAGARPYAPPAAAPYHHVTRIAPRPTRTPIPTVGFSHPTRNFTAPCLWIRPFVDDSDFPASSKRYPPTNPPDHHPLPFLRVERRKTQSQWPSSRESSSLVRLILGRWDFGQVFFGGGGEERRGGGITGWEPRFFRNEPTMP